MTDRPIIFSGPMVKALLAGRKTQTRRLATSPLRKAEPGDQLWVREAFKPVHSADSSQGARYRIDAGRDDTVWRPSIHMPRWASRLTLNVTDVRVEQLQAITDLDAQAEGIELESADPPFWWVPGLPTEQVYADPYCGRNETQRDCYGRLWAHLHGAGSWEANPEVVALTFTVEHVRPLVEQAA